jgi:hypothetical protein
VWVGEPGGVGESDIGDAVDGVQPGQVLDVDAAGAGANGQPRVTWEPVPVATADYVTVVMTLLQEQQRRRPSTTQPKRAFTIARGPALLPRV